MWKAASVDRQVTRCRTSLFQAAAKLQQRLCQFIGDFAQVLVVPLVLLLVPVLLLVLVLLVVLVALAVPLVLLALAATGSTLRHATSPIAI